jgi:hypothetical protein
MFKALFVLAAFTVLALPSFANDLPAAGNSFLAVSPSVLATHARVTDTDKALVHNYIMSQIATNNMTVEQFNGLTADQQRVVLVPGKAFNLTREVKRTIVPQRQAVPSSVIKQIVVNKPLSFDIIEQYGIDLPASITAELPELPSGYQRMLIGTHLVVLDGNSVVLDSAAIAL